MGKKKNSTMKPHEHKFRTQNKRTYCISCGQKKKKGVIESLGL